MNIPKEIIKFIQSKNVKTNIYRIQAYDSICVNNVILLF